MVSAVFHSPLDSRTATEAKLPAVATPVQRQAMCTLATLAATIAGGHLVSPAILVVGDVVHAASMWAARPAREKHIG